jgi:hypothetical protein
MSRLRSARESEPPRPRLAEDPFSRVLGQRRGADRNDAPKKALRDESRERVLWWWAKDIDEPSHMDLRRWLDACCALERMKLEVFFERFGTSDDGRWVIAAFELSLDATTRTQRVLTVLEVNWVVGTWPSHLWSRLPDGCLRGELA